jgi:hypothetical protein
MDDHTMRQLEDAMYIFAGDWSRGDVLDALGYLAYFAANLNTCHFREPIRELVIFCKHQYPTSIEDQNQSIINVTASHFLAMPDGGHDLNTVHQETNTWEPDMSTDFYYTSRKCTWKGLLDSTSKNAFVLMGSVSNFA